MTEKRSGSIVGGIFGAVFLVAGLLAGYFTFGSMTLNYFSTASWQKTPVEIEQLEFKRYRGDDSETYRVVATYHYYFNGVQYTSDKVSLSSTSDNVGDYWRDLHSRLNRERRSNQSYALVNPNKPNQALLDRTFRWEKVWFGMIFLLTFGVIGAAIVWASFRSNKSPQEELQAIAKDGIVSSNRYGFWFIFWFGLVFFFIGFPPAVFVVPDEIEKGRYAALFIILFPLIGAGLMFWGWKQRQNYKNLGPTPLFLDPLPAIVGGQVGAYFTIPTTIDQDSMQATLTCSQKVRRGKNTSESILWQKQIKPYCKITEGGTKVSFIFDLPKSSKPSTNSVTWKVDVEGIFNSATRQKKFTRNWVVPLMDGGKELVESTLQIPQAFLQEQAQQRKMVATSEATQQIPVFESEGYLNIQSLPGRNLGSTVMIIIFGLIFFCIGFALKNEWWPGYVFLVIGALILYWGVFSFGSKIEVKIDLALRMLHVRRSWFAFKLSQTKVALFDPKQFSIKKTSTQTQGNNHTEFFSIYVESKGKKLKLAEAISGREAADALLEKIIKEAFPNR